MVNKQDHVRYVDGLSKEHDAIVTAVNQRGDYCPVCQSSDRGDRRFVGGAPCTNDSFHKGTAPGEHYVTLVYVDVHRAESDNLVKVYDVKHISMLDRETNPDLTTFHVNAWKYEDEGHAALPEDHPAFDHPFQPQVFDESGILITTDRPKFATAVADHQNTMLAMAAGAVVPAPVPSGHDAKPDEASQVLGMQAQDLIIETKKYSDGTVVTGVAPLPELSSAQQDAAQKQPGDPAAESQALPTVADLDTVAEEKKAADDTSSGPCQSAEAGIVCGEPKEDHTAEAAKGDVGMDHPYEPPKDIVN